MTTRVTKRTPNPKPHQKDTGRKTGPRNVVIGTEPADFTPPEPETDQGRIVDDGTPVYKGSPAPPKSDHLGDPMGGLGEPPQGWTAQTNRSENLL